MISMKDSKIKYLPVKISKDHIILQEQFDKNCMKKFIDTSHFSYSYTFIFQ